MKHLELEKKDIQPALLTGCAFVGIVGGLFLLTLAKIHDGSFNHSGGLVMGIICGSILAGLILFLIWVCFKALSNWINGSCTNS